MPDVMRLLSFTTNGSALARVQAVSPGFLRSSLCSPSLRFVLSASLQGWANPLGLTLATPDLAGQAGVFAVSETQISISERNKFS
jgi:hypothetical protein